MRGGCRTATVLFTDLVGSTDLLSRLGEAAFDELRRAHFAALGDVVGRYRGEEVKTLGDGVLAVFDAAADAVAGAVAIQRAVTRQSRSAPAPLAVRVGLALGDVSVEDDDVFGTPVVEAARLVAVAGPGEILATSVVAVVAGGRCESTFTEVGSVELKGLPKPVAVCRVEWEPLDEPPVPMPALLTDVGRIFVGRDAELERLMQLWKEAAAGERRVALLAGEPGVGKTRLAAELAVRVHEEGGMVLAGRCDEDLGVPYQPFVEALRHYVLHAAGPRLGRFPGELVRLIPELSEIVSDLPPPLRSDPETERYRLFDAVAAWLADVSQEGPVLLVLDDLQWAAKPTLLLLRHTLRSAASMSLLMVGTYRDSDVGRGHPLSEFLADLRREQRVERLLQTGLDAGGVADYLVQAAGHDLDETGEELARAVWRETEGLPFFVVEVLRHLTESGAVARRGGRWVVSTPLEELGIPEGVRDVVGRRLSRLSDDANRVLACASVAGLEFEPGLIQAAGDFDPDIVFSAVEQAVAARLVVEVPGSPPRARFAHALVRATLYNELSAARRVDLHHRVGEAIEELHAGALDDHLPALAHHWSQAAAPAPRTAKAADYARRAGDRALAQLAHDEAVTYYEQAIGLLDVAEGTADEGRRCELLISLGEAQRRSGDPRHRSTLLQAAGLARQLENADALARAALANNSGFYSATGAVDDDRVAALRDALDLLGDDNLPIRARLLARLGLELVFGPDLDQAVAYSNEAAHLARRLGDPETLSHVLTARYYTALGPDTVPECLIDAIELVQVAARVDDPAVRTLAHMIRHRTAVAAGDLAEADRHLDTADQLARELGQPLLQWQVAYLQVGREMAAGHLDQAEQLIGQVAELGPATGHPSAGFVAPLQRAFLEVEGDRVTESGHHQVTVMRRQLSDQGGHLALVDALLALLDAHLGQHRRALDTLEHLEAEPPRRDIYWTVTTILSTITAVHLGDQHHMGRLSELAPYADQPGWYPPFPTAPVAHHLGCLASRLGSVDIAQTHLAAAAELETALDTPIWLARTHLEWARVLLTRRQPGNAERARELLGQALATAREFGLANVERPAADLLHECR